MILLSSVAAVNQVEHREYPYNLQLTLPRINPALVEQSPADTCLISQEMATRAGAEMASTRSQRSSTARTRLLPELKQVRAFDWSRLRVENQVFQNTGGVSAENRDFDFEPAFLDTATGQTYRSCFANGRKAPVHVLDGLPDEIVVARARPDGFAAQNPPFRRVSCTKAGSTVEKKPREHSLVFAGLIRRDRQPQLAPSRVISQAGETRESFLRNRSPRV